MLGLDTCLAGNPASFMRLHFQLDIESFNFLAHSKITVFCQIAEPQAFQTLEAKPSIFASQRDQRIIAESADSAG
jgi:hypothetical protein